MISGSEAFEYLQRGLRGEEDVEKVLRDPPFERLRLALQSSDASPPDLAVLVRHALRYESLRRDSTVRFEIDHMDANLIRNAGLEAEESDRGLFVSAMPWRPSWLPESIKVPADEGAMRGKRKRFDDDHYEYGDPFLKTLGKENGYRSIGQRGAVRAALSMPPGTKLIVDLPTGEGKSLVFQAIRELGFASDPPGTGSQLTVVIVPTVTLAYDHEANCGGSAAQPLAYVGGEEKRNSKILEALRNGEQDLLFAAPEAFFGTLRYAIQRTVRQGRLRAIVIDEAHLVEGWGTGFRTKYQTLAGLYHQWRDDPEGRGAFRLIFLSATYSEAAIDALHDLFGSGGNIAKVSASRIRLEPEFWLAKPAMPEDREARVLEALFHLPRPAILYVTKVDDAIGWYRRLKGDEIGFNRIRMVHGGTSPADREAVLKEWASGILDLVVATSAFGLGIDYPHVRAVIHACMPERLDRFYQEVGRVGRDGCTSISVLIPAFGDEQVAKRLSAQRIITVERGYQRWMAMFNSDERLDLGAMQFGLRMDLAPSYSTEDIDMRGERSVDWNARVLSVMARAGMIQLTGIPELDAENKDDDLPPYLAVRILVDGHSRKEVWEDLFEQRRNEMIEANKRSFDQLQRYVKGKECATALIASLYPDCAHACTSCRLCRINPSAKRPTGITGEPPLPWPFAPDLADALKTDLGIRNRMAVEYGKVLPRGLRTRDFTKVIGRLDQMGLRAVIRVGDLPDMFEETVDEVVAHRPWLSVRDSGWYPLQWPAANALIFVSKSVPLSAEELTRTAPHAQIIFLPEGMADAGGFSRRIADMLTIPKMSMQRFLERYLI